MKHQININGQTGAGAGLASIASALAAAGVEVSPARRAMGGECMTMRQHLESCERPAGPILQAIQAQLDLRLVQVQLRRLNKKMVGDGRESLWLTDHDTGGRGAGWATTAIEAMQDSLLALALWRAGVSLVRDDSGADCITLGDTWANVSAVWQCERGKYHWRTVAARVAYRAVSDSVSADTFGESAQAQAAAVDWVEWYQSNCGPMGAARTAAGLLAQWQAAHKSKRRFDSLQARCDTLASGNGRRGQVVAKVQQWALLTLGGMDCEQAAIAAGFKSSQDSGGRVRVSAYLRLASALRRMGLHVTSKRGAWAQVDEFEQAKRRGAAADLAALFVQPPRVQPDADLPRLPAPAPAAGQWCGARCLAAAAARGVHHSPAARLRAVGRKRDFGGLRFAWSQLPASARLAALPAGQRAALVLRAAGVVGAVQRRGLLVASRPAVAVAVASPSVAVDGLPVHPARARAIVAAFDRRKLRGVLRHVA